MSRIVVCTMEDFGPVIRAELGRGNGTRGRHADVRALSYSALARPLDLDAIRAQFELPDCIEVQDQPDGGNALLCRQSGVGLVGGTGRPGWLARRASTAWWRKFEERGRPRTVFAPRSEGGAAGAV